MYGISTIPCLKYNSTIFKTINSSVDETRKTLALFNKDWNTYKTNWQQGYSQNGFAGGVKSIFQSSSQNSVISKEQVQILRNWNNAVAHGCTNQETFNSIIANADDNTKMYFAGLNKGRGSVEGLKNAQNVAKQSTIGLTIAQTALNMTISMGLMAAISLAIKGFDKLINSAKCASEAADKAFSDTNEKVQQNEEEAKSLYELISKYKELKESGNLDIDGRKEVKELQNDIADLVGTQAKNLDLVNGKLDDEIKKLDEISAKEAKGAYETATANYNNSQKANAEATGDDSFLFVDGYAYTGKREKEAEKILKDAGFGNNNVQSGGFFGNTLFVMDSFDNNMKELKGAQEKADYLQSMIDVLEQNGQRATDLYAGLIKQRDDYLKYIDNQQNAANSLVNSWITYSQFSNEELSNINVDSVESFETYRQKMIEEAKNDESIGKILADGTLSDENLENAVNDFMATSLEFSIWYEQWLGNVQDSTSNIENPISFSEAFNSPDFSSAKKELLELASAGELTPETLSSTEEYKTLLTQTGLSAKDACESINKTVSAAQRLNYTASGLSSLTDVYKQANENGFADIESLYKLDDAFKNLDSYDEFVKTVGSGTHSMDEMQQAFNRLVSEYLEHTKVLDGLNKTNKELYVQQLKSYGIVNAQEKVEKKLAQIDYSEAIDSYFNANKGSESWCNSQQKLNNLLKNEANATLSDFTDGNYEAQQSLLKEAKASDICRKAVADLQLEQIKFNQTKLSVDENIKSLAKLADSYGITGTMAQGAVKAMNKVKEMQAKDASVGIMFTQEQLDEMLDETQSKLDALFEEIYDTSDTTPFDGGDDYKEKANNEAEKSKEIFDWIETKINRLKTVISELGETASNTFKSLAERASAYGNEISKVTEEIQLQKDAYNKYMEHANSVGLSEELASKVRNGSLEISEETDDKIKDYQTWYEKAQECLNTVNDLEQELAQLNIDRLQLSIDKASRNLDKFKSKSDKIQNKIDDDSRKTNVSDYNRLDKSLQNQITSYEEQNRLLREQQQYVDKNSQKWEELEAEIRENITAVDELKQSIKDNRNLRIQIKVDKVSRDLDKSQAKSERLQDKIDDDTYKTRESYYDRLNKSYSKEIKYYKEQNRLIKQQRKNVEKGSDAWNDYQESIEENNKSIKDLEQNIRKNKISRIQIRIDVKAEDLDNLEKSASKISDKISLKETSGQTVKAGDYSKLNANAGKQIKNLQAQNRLLRQQQKNVEKGSEAWNNYQDSIDSNNSSIRNLTKEMVENANAMAALNNEAADKKVERIDSSDELLDAKSANTSSYKTKNSYINSKARNIDKRQKAYDAAVTGNKTGLNKAAKAINATKSNSKNKSILAKIKSYVKSGKEIPTELIQSANSVDTKLAQECAKYNAYLTELESSKITADLYKETSKHEKAELAKEKQENIEKYYSDRQGVYDQRSKQLNSRIDLVQAKGYQVSTKFYDKLISNEKTNNTSLTEEHDKLVKSLANSVKNGSVKKYSSEWYELCGQIDDVTNAIDESNKSLIEYKNQMRQIKWDNFDYLEERISNIISESDFMINQLSRKDLTSDDTGGLTDEGKAVASLHLANYEAYSQQAEDYKEQIEEINKELAKDPYNKNLLKQKEEFVKLCQDSINGANDENEAIIDLCTKGYDALKNKIAEVISEYEEMLDAEKSAYDYQNTIADKTKQISTIKKQLAAFSNGESEETKAKVQKLTVSLEEAEKDLKDTQYDRFISDTKDILGDLQDNLSDDIDEIIKNMADNFDKLIKEIKDDAQLDIVIDTMKDIGYTPTEIFEAILNGEDIVKSTKDAIADTKTFQKDMNKFADEQVGNDDTKTGGDKVGDNISGDKTGQSVGYNSSAKQDFIHDNIPKVYPVSEKELVNGHEYFSVTQYIDKHLSSTKTPKSKLSDVNKVFYDNFNKKILSNKEIKELANLLCVSSDQKKSGQLYKKLKSIGINGFASGSRNMPYDQTALLAEEGQEIQFDKSQGVLRTVGQGDMVFTNEMAENLWKLAQNNSIPFNMDDFNTIPLPEFNSNFNGGDVNINMGGITMNGVNDPEEFSRELNKHLATNPKTIKILQNQSVGSLSKNYNSLGVKKYI